MTWATEGGHRLVVTGATGTLGRNFLDGAIAWPSTKIMTWGRPRPDSAAQAQNVENLSVDYSDQSAVAAALKAFQPTTVVHCAASGVRFPRPDWFEMIRFNVDTSLRLCEAVSQIPGCQFVYISTGLAYRDQGRALTETDPLDSEHPYGASKAAADILMRAAAAEFGVPMVVLRPFSFSGLGDTGMQLFPSLLRAAAENKPFDLSPGDQVRDHCAAADIARGIAQVVQVRQKLSAETQVFNLGSGSAVCLKALVENVVGQLELTVNLNFGARDYARFEPKYLAADISQAANQLQWRPQVNFAHAIWQLARESFPTLRVKEPGASL